MQTSFNEALSRGRAIPLGIRIALAGSREFCRDLNAVLAADPDVALVHELGRIGWDESFARVNALIVEPEFDTSTLTPGQLDLLKEVSLIAVIGPTLGRFAGYANAQCFESFTVSGATRKMQAVKDRVLHLRFQEFSGLVSALVSSQSGEDAGEMLEVDDRGVSRNISVTSIDWIRAAGNHVEIHTGGRSLFYRSEMQTIERKLPASFLRIHRKIIVNLQRLARIDADSSVRQFATLVTGERFLISRHRRTLVHARWAELRGQTA